MERLGLRVRVAGATSGRRYFTAGTVDARRADLRDLLADREVAAIVAARGGAGTGWLLRDLDPRLWAEPKWFVGCSDLTYLHLALARHRVVSLHGPMAASDLAKGRWDEASLRHGLFGDGDPYTSPGGTLLALRPGAAAGRLLGGCLSILASACGTPWSLRPDPTGTILFLEDVNEPPYRIDRMLLQLREAGIFDGVRGIVFGEMPGCPAPPGVAYTLEDVIADALSWFEGPVAVGLPSGHVTSRAVTLPLGSRAQLRCDPSGRASFAVVDTAAS